MNRPFIISILFVLLASCTGDSNDPLDANSIYGTWLLSDVLFDPGDGTGTFTPRDTGEELILRPNGTFSANWDPCALNSAVSVENSGDYLQTGEMSFEIKCPADSAFIIQGNLERGLLILYYPCIEGCAYRFYKTADLRG